MEELFLVDVQHGGIGVGRAVADREHAYGEGYVKSTQLQWEISWQNVESMQMILVIYNTFIAVR